MTVGAVVLAGGKSGRMGVPKHAVLIDGVSVLDRILSEFDRACVPVTILGGDPLANRAHLIDATDGCGPAAALVAFKPSTDLTFVIACDVPFFSAAVIDELVASIGVHDAAIPLLNAKSQFLCALYAKSAFVKWSALVASGQIELTDLSMHRLVANIDAVDVALLAHPIHVTGFNSLEELEELIASSRSQSG